MVPGSWDGRTVAPMEGHAAPFSGRHRAFQTFQGSPPRLPDPQLPRARSEEAIGAPGLALPLDAGCIECGLGPLTADSRGSGAVPCILHVVRIL